MATPLDPLTRERLHQLLMSLTDVHAAVVGDLMLDRYLIGDVERISPEAPVPVVSVDGELDAPGGAANVAASVVALGGSADLVGVIGADDAGTALRQTLIGYDIEPAGLIVAEGRPTTTKTRLLARGQQVVRIDREVTNPLAGPSRDSVVEAANAAIEDADVLLLADYDKGVLDPALISILIGAAATVEIPVLADPRERHFFEFAGCTVLKPNRREFELAFRDARSDDDGHLAAAREQLDVDNLLVTLGSDGMILIDSQGIASHTSTLARDVYDVSGAGDTVLAWLGIAIAAGATPHEATWLANLAAGIQVGKRGTATVAHEEIINAWDEQFGD